MSKNKYFVRSVFKGQRTSFHGDPLPEYEYEVCQRVLFWSRVIDRDFKKEYVLARVTALNELR